MRPLDIFGTQGATMQELTVLFFALLFKVIAICFVTGAAAFLAYHGKEGWGWLIFVAVLVASTSMRYTPDEPTCECQKETK